MFALLTIVHIVVSLVLILVVLLQSGKAGDLASAFGGAGSQTAFGARGSATVLTKATAICAILFMVTSLGLAIMYTRSRTGTVMDSLPLADEFSVSDVPAPVSDQAVPEQTPAEK
jgi:preprotein translocase subunit SecG